MGSQTVSGLLLADVESRRTGQPLPLLPWMGTTLVAYHLNQLTKAGVRPVIVVLGHEAKRVAVPLRFFPDAVLVANPSYDLGEPASIRAGLRRLPPGAGSILLTSIGQPRRAEILATLISAQPEGSHSIVVPSFQGVLGRPLLLPVSLMGELSLLQDRGEGLDDLLRRHQSELLEAPMDSPEVLIKIDSPESYHRALSLFPAP